jgi:plasmid stabilization system protein ParE
MKVVVRAKADADLDGIFAWVAKDNPAAAAEMIRRIRTRLAFAR